MCTQHFLTCTHFLATEFVRAPKCNYIISHNYSSSLAVFAAAVVVVVVVVVVMVVVVVFVVILGWFRRIIINYYGRIHY